MADTFVTFTFNDNFNATGYSFSGTVTNEFTPAGNYLGATGTISVTTPSNTLVFTPSPGAITDTPPAYGFSANTPAVNGVSNVIAFSFNGETPSVFTDVTAIIATQPAPPLDAKNAPVTSAVVCFASGTLIGTMRGDVAVEDLQAGDAVVTAFGEIRPITWVGHRVIDCAAQPIPSETWPVRVLAGAFGADMPKRDLFLSPGHPVLVRNGDSEVLVPIMCLINGTSIDRIAVDQVTYWHIELDRHDILFAEGLPAESFLDYGNRPWFENGPVHALANPDFIPPGLMGRCRPVAIDGPIVGAERRRLDALFETSLASQCAWPTSDEIALHP